MAKAVVVESGVDEGGAGRPLASLDALRAVRDVDSLPEPEPLSRLEFEIPLVGAGSWGGASYHCRIDIKKSFESEHKK